jgi:FMN-dependent NADH-azoreductase
VTLFRLDASFRTEGSVSRAVADTVQTAWQAEHPSANVIHRDLGLHPLPSDTWINALGANFAPAEHHTPEQIGAKALVTSLVDELEAAEAYLFAIPLYNFGVPASVKLWFDAIITDPRLAAGSEPVVAGRPAVLVTVRGGGYAEGTPRAGWDHNTPYLRRIFADVFKLDLEVVEAELTLADSNPAMEPLRGLAAESLKAAHDLAGEHGKTVAQRVLSNSAA